MHLNMVVGISKKIIVDNQVSLIIGGILDSHVSDWISADCDCLVALPFNAFMVEFRANYLAKDWEEDTLCKLLSIMQGSSSFWDFAITVQSKNSLLHKTTSHLPDVKLHQQISTGMELRLSKKVSSEKLNKVVDFCKWLNEVRRCDEMVHAEREEYERIAKEHCDSSHCMNNSGDPSVHCVPYNSNNTHHVTTTSTTSSAPHKQCPKLLDSECTLLNDDKGCVKCQNFFENHRAADRPNDFPNPATYRTLTQADVDHTKHLQGKCVAAVTMAMSLADTSSSSSPTQLLLSLACLATLSLTLPLMSPTYLIGAPTVVLTAMPPYL